MERAACGLPTAFRASWRKGEGPRIGLLAEYDALPGTGNKAVPRREAGGKRAGHACGHNQIGPANVGAAIAARRAMADACDGAGEIVAFGCPAEEIVWGKLALLRAGAFDRFDALLTSQADYQNGAISRPCQSVLSGEIMFLGESGHGGGVRRQNALDAAELAVQSIERLRAHHFPDTSVEHVLRVGGHMPSVTPDEARLWLVTRHVDFDRARESIASSSAWPNRRPASVPVSDSANSSSPAPAAISPTIRWRRILLANLERVGTPRYSEGISPGWRPCPGDPAEGALQARSRHGAPDQGHDLYGQDDGEASWHVPACPRQLGDTEAGAAA